MSDLRPWRRLLGVVTAAAALTATACSAAGSTTSTGAGSGDCSGLEGKTVTLVVPFSPGGGYDTYARMVAPYLAKELGAKVVVQNQDGAGGLLAINSLRAARPDGTKIAIMNAVGVGAAAIAEAEGVRFGLDDLSYLGRLQASQHLFVTATKSEFTTFDDVIEAKNFRYGSTGPGAADFINGHVLKEIFDLDAKVITGFEGSEENALAVTRGEVDGMTGDFDSRLPMVKSGDHRALLLMGPERDKTLPDVPALLEYDLDAEQTALAKAQLDLLEFGRPLVAPPKLPEDRLTCLRGALSRAMHHDDLAAEAKRTERPLNWMTGKDLERLVQRLLNSPPRYQKLVKRVYAG